jgi:hypothetical protein
MSGKQIIMQQGKSWFVVKIWDLHNSENSIHVFWVIVLCSMGAGYQHLGGPYCLYLQPWNVGIQPPHYMVQKNKKNMNSWFIVT